jgi:hypothetical protein
MCFHYLAAQSALILEVSTPTPTLDCVETHIQCL